MAGRGVGRHVPRRLSPNDFACKCDYCDVTYYRSQLVELANGMLACRGPQTLNDAKGRDEVTLSMLNAQRASLRPRYYGTGGGRTDEDL